MKISLGQERSWSPFHGDIQQGELAEGRGGQSESSILVAMVALHLSPLHGILVHTGQDLWIHPITIFTVLTTGALMNCEISYMLLPP